ncbi:murein biosynthesis integral membrane protein MurJ [Streptoalloteichus tenebrarius]|uniref:murein biosynthesis integral membrane protein MurJ n=1 Tax=Streptoalloteichus tenebrarius (strain ATCC 17920 / DSM 40477 / JCM 4838 / CBS 697.72 / NBRC 16177 / NCIMB 11028 / NRRL B-12390 / A12253. 1 / ISP 5477) TaxID=1933 RepID=UPI0020A5272D|nr:murein biosynthesis integral membrane protein MurJ [Streptoalloteichus tenebrarius]
MPEGAEAVASGQTQLESGLRDEKSLARDSASMALPTLISRATGFLSKLLLAAAVGTGAVNDSYQIAQTLPTIINELLLGGVLTSVVVPLLVRSQKEDADGGEGYTQLLITVSTVLLGIATVVATVAAPLLVGVYISSDSRADPALTSALAYLLLPEIVFLGLSALFGAILNARHVFGPPAWAPVLNNLVVIVVLLLYWVVPGGLGTGDVSLTNPKLLLLGVGTTLGIVLQAAYMLPALRRSGFRFRWRWGWDRRLNEFGGLAAWVIGYVAVSQVGVTVHTRVAADHAQGGITAFNYAWLLLQLPYGILGFSLLSAIMPRMSAAAADDDVPGVVAHLSQGARLMAVMLIPLGGVMTVVGGPLGVAFFSFGQSNVENASRVGLALAFSAFGLFPFALTMLQIRVFYAMKDARTPTLLMVVMMAVKIPLSYAVPLVCDSEQVVIGLSLVNSLSFVAGAVAGQVWLRVRLGRLETRRLLVSTGKAVGATVVGCAVAYGLVYLLFAVLPEIGAVPRAWTTLVLESLLALVASFGLLMLFDAEELRPAIRRISGLVRRR